MYATMQRFGLSGTTRLDFPGEARGMIRQPDQWTSTDKAAISFGQGFAVSGIQTITAFNALVNGGQLIKPHLVKSISDASGRVVSVTQPVAGQQLISRQTSDLIVSMMKSVVMKGGTAETAYMDNYQVFGKTGTAQKIDPLTGRYSGGGYISSFVGGIVDATGKPVLTMMVTIDDPHPSYYASVVACPAFKRITQKAVNIMDIRPLLTVAAKENQG
ncbi:MAG: Stage V sporulation protein D [Deltaproteobacteria bacterium ADurb.Bin510]|nr:MAG: Stage V sporulation protein D [Deltaproteobacteria bacterium ADurb.Bin510]